MNGVADRLEHAKKMGQLAPMFASNLKNMFNVENADILAERMAEAFLAIERASTRDGRDAVRATIAAMLDAFGLGAQQGALRSRMALATVLVSQGGHVDVPGATQVPVAFDIKTEKFDECVRLSIIERNVAPVDPMPALVQQLIEGYAMFRVAMANGVKFFSGVTELTDAIDVLRAAQLQPETFNQDATGANIKTSFENEMPRIAYEVETNGELKEKLNTLAADIFQAAKKQMEDEDSAIELGG
jgi:hypothetical protein